jgi:hypothetical protein
MHSRVLLESRATQPVDRARHATMRYTIISVWKTHEFHDRGMDNVKVFSVRCSSI